MSIAHCTLDATGLREQLDRYRRLGPAATTVEREDRRLVVTFGPALEGELLEQAMSVERRCCAALALEYDASARRLSIGAENAEGVEALEAIGSAITGATADRWSTTA